ncbi:MAG TPA: alpha-amylase family glycosyl hydrolase, partial [Flavisolibacter sp.]|nr:alpha-amylase family glycosyl hydrolase [Flavisolibacter sp.]
MALVSPKNGALVGGVVQLVFDPPVVDMDVKVNGINFHIFQNEQGCTLDLNALLPDRPITIAIDAVRKDDSTFSDTVVVFKPRHDLGGMGATVLHDAEGAVKGTFFKFWLPRVSGVYVRGSFNEWRDANRLNQLNDSGYWYGFVQQAQPGDDYMFFVYGADGNFDEVSDPSARCTKKTRFNAADANDANAVIIDPEAFRWQHDEAFLDQRKDFRKHIIYQAHWGTFMRLAPGDDYSFETFVQGTIDTEKRQSVRTKLQYIRDLGFTVIQLLPIHEANGNFNAGYDPSFFFAVETAYGLPADLRILVDEAHGIGLAVIFDSVINHLTKDETH